MDLWTTLRVAHRVHSHHNHRSQEHNVNPVRHVVGQNCQPCSRLHKSRARPVRRARIGERPVQAAPPSAAALARSGRRTGATRCVATAGSGNAPRRRLFSPPRACDNVDQQVPVLVLLRPVAGGEDGGGVHLLDDRRAGEGGGGGEAGAGVDGGRVPCGGEADRAAGGLGVGEGGGAGGGVEEDGEDDVRGRWEIWAGGSTESASWAPRELEGDWLSGMNGGPVGAFMPLGWYPAISHFSQWFGGAAA